MKNELFVWLYGLACKTLPIGFFSPKNEIKATQIYLKVLHAHPSVYFLCEPTYLLNLKDSIQVQTLCETHVQCTWNQNRKVINPLHPIQFSLLAQVGQIHGIGS